MIAVALLPDALPASLAMLVAAGAVAVTALFASVPRWKSRTGDIALLAFALVAAAAVSAIGSEPAWAVHGHVAVDPFATFFHIALALVAVAVAWLSARAHDAVLRSPFAWTALAASLLGTMLLASATSVLALWAGFEIVGVSCAAWMALHDGGRPAGASSMLRGVLASATLLAGSALLAGLAGASDYATLAQRLVLVPSMPGGRAAMYTGVAMVVAALGSRAATLPWVWWPAGDAARVPMPVTAWILAGGGLAGFAAMARFLADVVSRPGDGGAWTSPGGLEWASALSAAAVLTMLAGTAALLRESNTRRLLGWMAVAQAGWLVMGLSAAATPGLAASMLHAVVSATTMLGLAAALDSVTGPVPGVFPEVPHGSPVDERVDAIRGLLRRGGRTRVPAVAFVVFLLSWAGLWPLAGWSGRVALFSSAVAAGQWMLVVGAAASTVVGAMGTLRLLAILLDRGGSGGQTDAAPSPAGLASEGDADALLLVGLLLAAVVGLGVAPSGLASFAARSVVFFGG